MLHIFVGFQHTMQTPPVYSSAPIPSAPRGTTSTYRHVHLTHHIHAHTSLPHTSSPPHTHSHIHTHHHNYPHSTHSHTNSDLLIHPHPHSAHSHTLTPHRPTPTCVPPTHIPYLHTHLVISIHPPLMTFLLTHSQTSHAHSSTYAHSLSHLHVTAHSFSSVLHELFLS